MAPIEVEIRETPNQKTITLTSNRKEKSCQIRDINIVAKGEPEGGTILLSRNSKKNNETIDINKGQTEQRRFIVIGKGAKEEKVELTITGK